MRRVREIPAPPDRGGKGRARRGRQGRHDQSHHRAGEPAHLPCGRASRADRAREVADVRPALPAAEECGCTRFLWSVWPFGAARWSMRTLTAGKENPRPGCWFWTLECSGRANQAYLPPSTGPCQQACRLRRPQARFAAPGRRSSARVAPVVAEGICVFLCLEPEPGVFDGRSRHRATSPLPSLAAADPSSQLDGFR